MGHIDQVELVNLTPHNIVIRVEGAESITLHSQGVARVSTEREPRGFLPVGGALIPTAKNKYGEVTGLPDPERGKVYIVSGMVLAALGDTRPDVYAPDTGATAIRDESGRIVAVTQLLSGD